MNNRYSRQILFTPIGESGQTNIGKKHVLIIGAGALGSMNAEMLVRAGIGKLTIIDRDYVDWSNLQRQQLYTEQDVIEHMPKAIAAKQRLELINKKIVIDVYAEDASITLLKRLADETDLIVDATDNFETRFIINDIAQKYSIPWIYGACIGSYGLCYTILPGETACLSCLVERIPVGGATCDTAGILSPAVSMVVSYQVSEALKLLSENRDALRRELVSFDIWKNEYSSLNVQGFKKTDCLSCGLEAIYPYLQEENISKTAILCGRDTVQIRPSYKRVVNLQEQARVLHGYVKDLVYNPYLLSFQTGENRIVLFKDGRVLVHGTKNITEAKTLYHRYFG
ncbi:thiazole biosynthesis adenylyltransferase ThiF [Bacillus sp. 165]|uniref:thiazole biosynthesis adenylyltransferase ThiF n=1 Tax=Bacillus sp. 165 TaxID=1529117 RepID=UPI001ADB5868|nr:thiazole biosynthesis adenylyltransferase ThiF [Bacillus sp. 165]MBO9128834.1 thiazole biosynthesis adenylyltransferase ThiF [Bacillus sp. 165]